MFLGCGLSLGLFLDLGLGLGLGVSDRSERESGAEESEPLHEPSELAPIFRSVTPAQLGRSLIAAREDRSL